MRLHCDGQTFTTSPDFFIQAEYLSEVIRAAPEVFREESGGLLRGLVKDKDYDMVWACEELQKILTPLTYDYRYAPAVWIGANENNAPPQEAA